MDTECVVHTVALPFWVVYFVCTRTGFFRLLPAKLHILFIGISCVQDSKWVERIHNYAAFRSVSFFETARCSHRAYLITSSAVIMYLNIFCMLVILNTDTLDILERFVEVGRYFILFIRAGESQQVIFPVNISIRAIAGARIKIYVSRAKTHVIDLYFLQKKKVYLNMLLLYSDLLKMVKLLKQI